MRSLGTIIYRGPSELTGDPIVAIRTNGSSNAKTGGMDQLWIIPDLEVPPHVAARAGADESVCGDCPLRHHLGGMCYVVLYQAPHAVWSALQRGRYAPWDGRPQPAHRALRLGAYGDPAAIPVDVLRKLLPHKDAPHTGYTRQWDKPFAQPLKSICMASVHTPEEAARARAMGWRCFEVLPFGAEPATNAKPCPASDTITCSDCLACDGTGARRSGRYIAAHGSRKARHPLAMADS